MNTFRDCVEQRIDYATVNDRVFLNNVSLGVYAELIRQDSYRDDRVGTAAKMVMSDLLNRRARPFDVQFTTPEGDDIDSAFLLLVSNNPYVVGAPPDIGQRNTLDGGTLGVFAVTARTGVEAARLLETGPRHESPSWHEFVVSTLEVRSHAATVAAGIDGEAVDLTTPMRFRSHPLGLTMLVTRQSTRVAARRRGEAHKRLPFPRGRPPSS